VRCLLTIEDSIGALCALATALVEISPIFW
jgi:hypothetical protein